MVVTREDLINMEYPNESFFNTGNLVASATPMPNGKVAVVLDPEFDPENEERYSLMEDDGA